MALESKLGRGKPLKSQTKEVLVKIFKYFESEIERDQNSTVTAAQLVTYSTGISMNALKRVITEHKTNAIVKKEHTSIRKRWKKKCIVDKINAQAIRRIIHNFYTKDEEFPIMKDLYLIAKADIDYQGSLCTLRRNVAKLGFRWVEKEDNNNILIEKQDVRLTRTQYLKKIDDYRSQGRNIVYTGEVTIESSRVASKPKQDGSSTILKHPAKLKLVILLAGDQQLMKKSLFMFDGNKKEFKEEFESKKENFEQYDKWFKFNIIPNLKTGSVVVVDSGVNYHNRLSNPTPKAFSRKKEMMEWLTFHNVPYSPEMYKPELYHLILISKAQNNYKTDLLLRENGHIVLRLPPHHPDLNPIKNILFSVQNYIGTDVCLSLESVMKIAKEKIISFTEEEWNHACKTSEVEENNLKAIEKIIDKLSENTFKSVDEEALEDSDGDDDNVSDPESMDSD